MFRSEPSSDLVRTPLDRSWGPAENFVFVGTESSSKRQPDRSDQFIQGERQIGRVRDEEAHLLPKWI
jgi:hypothetical protein